jgi:hypothetical protein
MHAMLALCACVFTAQCRLDTAVVSVPLFSTRLCCSSPNNITKQFHPHPQQPWTLYIKFQSIVTSKFLYTLIPSQSNVFIHVVFSYGHWQVCMKGHGMSTAHISAVYTLHQLCNCLVQFYMLIQCFMSLHATPMHFCLGKVLFSCMNAVPFYGHQHDVFIWYVYALLYIYPHLMVT